MRGLLAWDLEGIGVARTPAPDSTPGRTARPAAPGPVTTAVQAVRRASTLTSDQWARRPYTTAPLDRALRLVVSVTSADRPDDAQLPAPRSGPPWTNDGRVEGQRYDALTAPRLRTKPSARPRPTPIGDLALSYALDSDGDLLRVTAHVSPDEDATVDFVAARVRAGVPAAPWSRRP
jgi:hypothetical protein